MGGGEGGGREWEGEREEGGCLAHLLQSPTVLLHL